MKNRRSHTKGMALAVVLLVLTVVATLAAATGGLGTLTLQQVRESALQFALQQGANGGLHELMDALYGNEAYASAASGTYTTSSGVVTYRWTFDPASGRPFCTNNLRGTSPAQGWEGRTVPAGTAMLVVTASVADRSARTAGVGAVVVNNFPYAVAADGSIQLGSVSAPGDLLEAHVRSNLQGGSPNISAGLVEGHTFSRDGHDSIRVDGDGIRNYNEPHVPLPDLPIARIVQSYSQGGVNGQRPYGGPARFIYNQNVVVNTDAQGNLNIQGDRITPVNSVYVNGNVTFNGSPTVAPGIHMFVNGDITVNGALTQMDPGEVNGPNPRAPGRRSTSSLSAENSFMVCTGTLTMNGGSASSMHLLARNGIVQNGSSTWRGLVYVQNGQLTMNGSHTLEGAIIARNGVSRGDVTAGNLDLEFEPNVVRELMGLNLGLNGFVRPRSWWLF